eukprot:2920047-Pleurochrysis_carterae.AAC.4
MLEIDAADYDLFGLPLAFDSIRSRSCSIAHEKPARRTWLPVRHTMCAMTSDGLHAAALLR